MFHNVGSLPKPREPRRSSARRSCSSRRRSAPAAVDRRALERAGLPKSTTSRLVGALERQGLVQRLGDRGRLRPGPVLLRYASRDSSQALVELAQPSLRRLADASGETINLAVPGTDGVEHLAQEDTAHLVGVTDWVGRRVPFELAANGKCFLAFARRRA